MSKTKAHRLTGALEGFVATSSDVEAAAVVSFDGLTMASALPEDLEDDRVGAMSAALLSLGEQAARGLGRGELHQLFVEADGGYVFLMSARDQAVLVAITGREAKIGLILYEMRRAADDIGTLLDDGAVGCASETDLDLAVNGHVENGHVENGHAEGWHAEADGASLLASDDEAPAEGDGARAEGDGAGAEGDGAGAQDEDLAGGEPPPSPASGEPVEATTPVWEPWEAGEQPGDQAEALVGERSAPEPPGSRNPFGEHDLEDPFPAVGNGWGGPADGRA